MMKSLRSILALWRLFCGPRGGRRRLRQLAAAGVPGDSVAVVAGNPITHHGLQALDVRRGAGPGGAVARLAGDHPRPAELHQVHRRRAQGDPALAKTPAKTLKTDCSQLFTTLSGQVMDFLIKAYWYQADAHKLGIKVTDAQVQKALDNAQEAQFSTDAQFQSFLKTSGPDGAGHPLPRPRQPDLPEAQRQAPLDGRRHGARSPTTTTATSRSSARRRRATCEIVLTKTQAEANAAKAAIQSGQSWSAVAKKYSIDPSKSTGGVLNGRHRRPAGHGALQGRVRGAAQHSSIGPVKSQFGYYVFKVTKINAGHAALAGAVHRADQADADQPAADPGADGGRQPRQEGLAQEDVVPQAVRDGRLQRLQGAQDDAPPPAPPAPTGAAGAATAPPAPQAAGTATAAP